jgi:transposase-like protein
MAEVGTLEVATVNDVDGPSDSIPGDFEVWVKKITCPICGSTTEPTGRAFTFGVFDGRSYLCEECGKPFNAFYRDRAFSHTVPKGDVKLIDTVEKEIAGASDSKPSDVEGWVKDITCPRCGVKAEPTGKAFVFGVFDGRSYRCDGCEKSFTAYYRNKAFSHTVPKGDVKLIDIVEREIDEPAPEAVEIGEEGALPTLVSPSREEEPRVRAEEEYPETGVPGPPPSVEEILESMRGLKEDLAYINEISAEEGAIVEAFFVDFLRVMTTLRGALEVDVSVLPPELGDSERASVTPKGGLVVLRRDGNMESIDLTAPRNRDLFVTVIDNVLPKIVVLSAEIRDKIENRLKYLSRVTKELHKMASSLPGRR